MSFRDKKNSLITILSSTHGQLRREQRDIDKRDLQRALKYGQCERTWGYRWKIDYDGITFITDNSMIREVTAYPSPLPTMNMDSQMILEHARTKELLSKKPELATSHTILVIDNSGSMLGKKNDIHLYRDSQNAAFSMAALEFVAEQIFSQSAVNSDLISLIKFSSEATVEFSMEPIGWSAYNALLSHRNTDSFRNRQMLPTLDLLYGETNYLLALKESERLLRSVELDETCALSLYFLSDGQSTDHMSLGIREEEARTILIEKMSAIATEFSDRLSVSIVGLGNSFDDFSLLRDMSSAASAAGAKSTFELCDRTANNISSSISSLVSSTTETRLALQSGKRRGYTQRSDLVSEDVAPNKFDWKYFPIDNHFFYHPGANDFVQTPLLPLAAIESKPTEAELRIRHPPPFLAINQNYFGKGAERVAFRCRLSDKTTADGFVFDNMVAKETKDIERLEEKVSFHQGFAETQDLANFLATEFNKHLASASSSLSSLPQISFISCSVLQLRDSNWPSGLRGVLVEKMLDTDRFKWTKWNDNNGMVGGVYHHMPLDIDFELKQLQKEDTRNKGALLDAIGEEEEESDEDEDLSDVEAEEAEPEATISSSESRDAEGVIPADYLQAFTHFTYRYTKKRVMVCDLQGIFNTSTTPPKFELTDPAIHYSSSKGRRMVYGRTDKGPSGIMLFFGPTNATKSARGCI